MHESQISLKKLKCKSLEHAKCEDQSTHRFVELPMSELTERSLSVHRITATWTC